MDYSISEFAQLTGVSERTLRFYHERGLLHPTIKANGYRRFTSADADTMQLIRFYTAAGFTLTAVGEMLQYDVATQMTELQHQRAHLLAERERLSQLIAQVDSTIANQEDKTMTDTEKFAAFKNAALQQNDAQYGVEVTAKWGQEAKQQADRHFAGIDEETYKRSREVEQKLASTLRDAVANGDVPTADSGKQAYALHRQWLEIMWPHYEPVMHANLMDMYAADARFASYYDKLAGAGASEFLIAAVRAFAK